MKDLLARSSVFFDQHKRASNSKKNANQKVICDVRKLLALTQREQPERKHRFMAWKVFQQREEQGQYHIKAREVRSQDIEYFYGSVCNFNHLWCIHV